MSRHDESFEDDFEHAAEIGEINLTCITEMKRWCKHFKVEMQSSGLYAQMARLPIGFHQISCPFTDHMSGSGNLQLVCTRFLVEACDGCPHHEPNGDESWARKAISDHHESIRLRDEQIRQRAERIEQLRTELRLQFKSIGAEANSKSQTIAEFFEQMFEDSPETRDEASAKLIQSAQVGADLFPAPAVELLITLFPHREYSDAAMRICAELARHRPDLSNRLVESATEAIRQKHNPHEACAILTNLGSGVGYPLERECIECLLLSQYHDIPIGGWGPGWEQPDYKSTNEVLAQCVDADEGAFLAIVEPLLQHQDDSIRKHFCGALNLLQQKRPAIIQKLLPDLLKSLERKEKKDITHGGPSGKIIHIFQAAFRHSPKDVDTFLDANMERVRPTVQEEIVHVYRDQFFNRDKDWREYRNRTEDANQAERTAIDRLLTWIKNERLEPETRLEAAEALDMACSHVTVAMIKEFDTLLGYYALLCERKDPPPAPAKIILPGEPEEDPILKSMQKDSRNRHWHFFKNKIVACLDELCESRPREAFGSVYGCLNQANAHLGDEFRATAVTLLGKVGGTFGLQAQALPIVMRELMNYGSAWVRAKAIDAIVEMFHSAPPSNIADVIVVHLRDPLVIVHQAAVRAVDSRGGWFDLSQSREALQCLSVLAYVYRTDAFELRRICEATAAIGRRHPSLRDISLSIMESVFPTKEEHVDDKLVEEMISMVKPSEEIAWRVAIHTATFLAMHDRDRMNGASWDRDRMWNWLHDLPSSMVASISGNLLKEAKKLAARDFWESWLFASLFAKNNILHCEQATLEAIRDGYPDEHKFKESRRRAMGLSYVSVANQYAEIGDSKSSKDALSLALENLK